MSYPAASSGVAELAGDFYSVVRAKIYILSSFLDSEHIFG